MDRGSAWTRLLDEVTAEEDERASTLLVCGEHCAAPFECPVPVSPSCPRTHPYPPMLLRPCPRKIRSVVCAERRHAAPCPSSRVAQAPLPAGTFASFKPSGTGAGNRPLWPTWTAHTDSRLWPQRKSVQWRARPACGRRPMRAGLHSGMPPSWRACKQFRRPRTQRPSWSVWQAFLQPKSHRRASSLWCLRCAHGQQRRSSLHGELHSARVGSALPAPSLGGTSRDARAVRVAGPGRLLRLVVPFLAP